MCTCPVLFDDIQVIDSQDREYREDVDGRACNFFKTLFV